MRLVTGEAELVSRLASARREAKGAFGNDAVLLERYVTSPHHIEVQVFGDTHGNYVHLYERECSIQRRHQKVLEETPSPFVDTAMRHAMGEAAVAAARAIAYRGAGTIEFIVGSDRRFYFMEMNTRLQVEHPVTEMTTGEDLVEWQLRVAAGERLPRTQQEIGTRGHAIEVRLCAENPARDFLPETGRIGLMRTPAEDPGQVRVENGVREGDEVSVFYDPMIAKLVAWGEDRPAAARRLAAALGETAILGVVNNVAFLERVVASPAFLAGDTDTGFIERHRGELLPASDEVPDAALIAAAARVLRDEDAAGVRLPASPWNATDGWWTNRAPQRRVELRSPSGTVVDVEVRGDARRHEAVIAGRHHDVAMGGNDSERFELSIDGVARISRVLRLGERITVAMDGVRHELERVDPFHYDPVETLPDARLTSLMPGRVVKVLVSAGSEVAKGQPLMILEAMKMEHTIASPRAGVIERVAYRENDLVPAEATLFAFRE
jgi:3-methylcrotonyl-CoA carboxylase alpha subunit